MAIVRTNMLATIGGIMAVLGALPTLATNSHLALPLWWNDCTATLNLIGILGLAVLGYAAKGADEHSSTSQVEASSLKKEAEAVAQQADAVPEPVTKVAIVDPVVDSDILKSPENANAEIQRLRAELSRREKPS